MNIAMLKKQWLQSEVNQKKFIGWDFSYLKNKCFCEVPDWDYQKIVLKYLKKDMQLLDMGTGGGELLATFGNSHESFDISEVKRVLKPGGIFISQQVGDFNGVNLASRVIPGYKKVTFDFHLALVTKALKNYDFDILYQDEAYLKQEFYDMDGLIYYLRTIPWEFPDFSVANNFAELLDLQQELLRRGSIFNLQHRFVFVCRNMK